MFKRQIEYIAKIYVVSDAQDITTSLSGDLHKLISRHGARFTGGDMHRDESDGWAHVTERFRASPESARKIFDEWVALAEARADVVLIGRAYGSVENGWDVREVSEVDEEREETWRREWLRQHYPKGHRELYGG